MQPHVHKFTLVIIHTLAHTRYTHPVVCKHIRVKIKAIFHTTGVEISTSACHTIMADPTTIPRAATGHDNLTVCGDIGAWCVSSHVCQWHVNVMTALTQCLQHTAPAFNMAASPSWLAVSSYLGQPAQSLAQSTQQASQIDHRLH